MFSVAFTKKVLLPDKRLGVADIIKALWTVTTDCHKHTLQVMCSEQESMFKWRASS